MRRLAYSFICNHLKDYPAMKPDELIDISIPEGVVIELSALPGAELLTGASSIYWGEPIPSPRKKGTRKIECRDLTALLKALDGSDEAE
jgi:hypothetical protein